MSMDHKVAEVLVLFAGRLLETDHPAAAAQVLRTAADVLDKRVEDAAYALQVLLDDPELADDARKATAGVFLLVKTLRKAA